MFGLSLDVTFSGRIPYIECPNYLGRGYAMGLTESYGPTKEHYRVLPNILLINIPNNIE